MIGDSHPTADDHKIAQHHAPRGARLTGKHAMAPSHRVVPDLHQIINFGTFPEDGIAKRPTVHGRIGADLHAVLNEHPSKMRHLDMPIGPGGISEDRAAEDSAGLDQHIIGKKGVGYGRMRADLSAPPNCHPASDNRVGADPHVGADLGVGPDHHPRCQHDAFAQARRRMHNVSCAPNIQFVARDRNARRLPRRLAHPSPRESARCQQGRLRVDWARPGTSPPWCRGIRICCVCLHKPPDATRPPEINLPHRGPSRSRPTLVDKQDRRRRTARSNETDRDCRRTAGPP